MKQHSEGPRINPQYDRHRVIDRLPEEQLDQLRKRKQDQARLAWEEKVTTPLIKSEETDGEGAMLTETQDDTLITNGLVESSPVDNPDSDVTQLAGVREAIGTVVQPVIEPDPSLQHLKHDITEATRRLDVLKQRAKRAETDEKALLHSGWRGTAFRIVPQVMRAVYGIPDLHADIERTEAELRTMRSEREQREMDELARIRAIHEKAEAERKKAQAKVVANDTKVETDTSDATRLGGAIQEDVVVSVQDIRETASAGLEVLDSSRNDAPLPFDRSVYLAKREDTLKEKDPNAPSGFGIVYDDMTTKGRIFKVRELTSKQLDTFIEDRALNIGGKGGSRLVPDFQAITASIKENPHPGPDNPGLKRLNNRQREIKLSDNKPVTVTMISVRPANRPGVQLENPNLVGEMRMVYFLIKDQGKTVVVLDNKGIYTHDEYERIYGDGGDRFKRKR